MSRRSVRVTIKQLQQEIQSIKDQTFDFLEKQFWRKINKDKTGGKYNEFNMEYGSKQQNIIFEKIQKIRENDNRVSPFAVGIYDYYYLCREEVKHFISLSKCAKFYNQRGKILKGTKESIEFLDSIILDDPDCPLFDIFIQYQDYFRIEAKQKQNDILRNTIKNIKKCKKSKQPLPESPIIPTFHENIPQSVIFTNDMFIAMDIRSSKHRKYGNVKCIINSAKYNIDTGEVTDDVNLINLIIEVEQDDIVAELASHKLFSIEAPTEYHRIESKALEQEQSKQIKLKQQINGLLDGTYPLYLTNLMKAQWAPNKRKKKSKNRRK